MMGGDLRAEEGRVDEETSLFEQFVQRNVKRTVRRTVVILMHSEKC